MSARLLYLSKLFVDATGHYRQREQILALRKGLYNDTMHTKSSKMYIDIAYCLGLGVPGRVGGLDIAGVRNARL